VMVRETSQLFVAGPPVVARTGQELSKEELGGSKIHTRNGVVDDEVGSEEEAFERARRFLSYLPSSVHELPPRAAEGRQSRADQEELRGAIPADTRKVYKFRNTVEALGDDGSFFEIGRGGGTALASPLALIAGCPDAVL